MKVNIGPYVNRMMSNVHTHYMNKTYGYVDWPEYGQKGLSNKVEPLKERSLRVTEDTLQWIYNHTINLYLERKERRVQVKIHKYDTWSMDSTLAPIILPMLKQLRDTKHGAPLVDDEDVPDNLKSTNAPIKENECDTDANYFKRWDYVLDEMIWAFEQKNKDDYYGSYIEGNEEVLSGRIEWVDDKGIQAHQTRMTNAFQLFGKYYESLWD